MVSKINLRQQRITIIRYRKPAKKEINEELQFLGNSLGLFGERDKDKSCFRIFIELLKATRANMPLSSDEIAMKTGLSRGTVVHHLHRLIEAGLVVYESGKFMLRAGNLETVVEEVQKDINRTLDDLRQIAAEIDKRMGI
ncbi:MAG: ArsR family transcriptional regulator [Candidatus Woesearchaeota archaeon]|nr:ArsR family transcriptional regulator [Candidatus Woesearchaeota archaeon]